MPKNPQITALRDASIGFGLWPWSNGPLWRLDEPWPFVVANSGVQETYTIPAGYEFDKASVPSFVWGFPFNYTPDGLCTTAALEHDYLCDLFQGGSAWLKKQLGTVPKAPIAAVIHRHFYDRLLAAGVRPSKASTMYAAVRNFGPGGRAWPKNWFARGAAAVLAALMLPACGTTRAQRLQLYGAGATMLGHPEVGVPLGVLGRGLERYNNELTATK